LFEDLPPAFVYGGAVAQILLIKLVFEPTVDTHFRIGFQCHGKRRMSSFHDSVSGKTGTVLAGIREGPLAFVSVGSNRFHGYDLLQGKKLSDFFRFDRTELVSFRRIGKRQLRSIVARGSSRESGLWRQALGMKGN
jgi:hypothetical protein